MKNNNWSGRTVKFTIGPDNLDCYLTIGEVDNDNVEDYPHLRVGEPCYFDLTLSRAGEELRVYSLLTTLLTRLIIKGENPRNALALLRGQAFEPSGLVAINGGRLHHYKSIPDLVARYVTDAYYKEETNT